MKLSTYIIGQGDTLEILCQSLMSDPSQENNLIQLNKLRYPYISDDPVDQFANPKGNIYLVGSYTNPSVLTINNSNAVSIQPNDTIYLQAGLNVGSGVVQSISGSTLTLQDSISGTFDAGAIVTVFGNQQNVTTQVLKTGDTLLYPFVSGSSLTGANSFNLVFGTDLKLDDNSFLMRSDQGDIVTVSGLDNLGQAVKMRLQTLFGALLLHPEYGNQMLLHLGEAGTPYFSGLARYYALECVSQDPRVHSVDVADFSIIQDKVYLNLKIVPIGSQDPITQSISFKIGGVN